MEPDHLHFSHELDIEGGTVCVTVVVAVALGGGRFANCWRCCTTGQRDSLQPAFIFLGWTLADIT